MDVIDLQGWQRRLRFEDREAAEKLRLSISAFRRQLIIGPRPQTAFIADVIELCEASRWLSLTETTKLLFKIV